MAEFRAPVDDLLYAMQCVVGAVGVPAWDAGLAQEVITQFARFAEAELAPLNASGDAQGCRVEGGRVRMPEGFRVAYARFAEQGWPALAFAPAHGGQGMPALLQGGVTEIFAGANHAMQMLCGLVNGAAGALTAHGTPAQQSAWLPRLAGGAWLATMCMTEAGAGSDLSRVRTRATADAHGWKLDGEKIFISGGDQDLSEGILHLVLARSGATDSGNRGLSLFLCPSLLESGARNAVRLLRIEDKLGLHASPTCQLLFEGARAELLGNEGEGLTAMFVMMNHARVDVGLQGLAHASRAGALARAYAAARVQGPGQVSIDRHADVRRMLDEQRVLELESRLLCLLALGLLDAGGSPDLVDFLTPVCKHFGSQAGIRAADLGIQVLGGYGYLREYGMEQAWRDARVTAIYEGANGIHAMTLAGRLLRHRDGVAADAFAQWAASLAVLADGAQAQGLRSMLDAWSQARQRVAASDDPGAVAQAFMALTTCLARLAAWVVMLRAGNPTTAPADLERLAGDQLRRLPLRARYWAGLIA